MKRYIIIIKNKPFLVVLFIFFQSIVSYAQQYQCPYFTMELGKTWHYRSINYPDTLISSIVDTATIGGRFYYSFAPYGTNPNLQRYWLRPDPYQIFALNMQDTTEYLLFDFTAGLNESWEIPPDSSNWNVPVNQCDWGTKITLFSNSDTVDNVNRIFTNCFLFVHLNHPCQDAGIGNTWFERDFGMVRFSQVTEGGVLDWDLIIEKPDTTLIVGEYSITGNPCLNDPCIPGVVSSVKANDTVYVLSRNGVWFWNGDFSWNEYNPSLGDSVIVNGVITNRTDITGEQYYTIEVIDFLKFVPTFIADNITKYINAENILYHNYPNPFNPKTIIKYFLSDPSNVKIIIYDINGRKVKTILNEHKKWGHHIIEVNGEGMPSGSYYYQLITNNNIQTKSMTLIK